MIPLRLVVADDEPLPRERLVRMLRDLGCEVLAEFADGMSLLEWLRQGAEVDGLFLDIRMPGATGLEVLAELPTAPPTVFVTAFSESAVRAFELAAADYLLKPVYPPRLALALERLRNQTVPRPRSQELRAVMAGPAPERFPVTVGEGHLLLELRKVSHFILEDRVVLAWIGEESFRTLWTSLLEVEEAFPDAGLLRIQRDTLVRPEAIIGLKDLWNGRTSLRLKDGIELVASRGVRQQIRQLFGIDKK